MTKKAAVIGLGGIGASLALGLRSRGDLYTVVGSDPDKHAEQLAAAGECVDAIEHNLFKVVDNADLILLAVSAEQTKKTLELIGREVRADAVILDCCPDKAAALRWAKQFMLYPDNFIGIWPGISPDHLDDPAAGVQSISGDLFRRAVLFIAAETNTSEAAINAASALADLLGMERAFIDSRELDGLIATVTMLPVLSAHGLMGTLRKQPGWTDAKKAAGKTFAQMTAPLRSLPDPEEGGTDLLENRENTIRVLNDYIAELISLRELLRQEDAGQLSARLAENRSAREQWLTDQRQKNKENAVKQPTASAVMEQTFFGGLLRRKKRS